MFWKNKDIGINDPVYSTRETIILWQYLLKHGYQIEKFFDGVGIPRQKLLDKRKWIDIKTSAKLTQNYRACIPDYDMTKAYDVAFEQFDSYAYGFTSGIFRLPSLQYVFRALPFVMTIPTRIEFFKILESNSQSAVIEYTIYPGFEPFINSSFIYTWSGVFAAIPTIHGLSPAKVDCLGSFIDIFRRFREDFNQFKYHIEEKRDGIYLDGEKAGRWIIINRDTGLDPIIQKYLLGEKCVLWEKDVVRIKESGEKVTIARKGELYNCSKTILHIQWENINFLSRVKTFILFLKQYVPMQRQSRNALHRQTEILYEYSSLLKQKVKEKSTEVRNAQAKMFELEKRSIEHRITGGFAHEMRNTLTGAQLGIQAAMRPGGNQKPVTDSLKESVAAVQKKISMMYPESNGLENEKNISDSIRELKQIRKNAEFLSEIISDVSDDIERGLSITSQIHEYAKLHEVKAGDTPVNVFLLLEKLGREYRASFRKTGINYVVNCPKALFFNANETHLNSIFNNVILNARDALEDDITELPEIVIDVQKKENRIQIGIQDNGPGIEQGLIKDIFKPFVTTKPPKGKGLGLSFVKRLLALYNGQISVETRVGKGTRFSIILPG